MYSMTKILDHADLSVLSSVSQRVVTRLNSCKSHNMCAWAVLILLTETRGLRRYLKKFLNLPKASSEPCPVMPSQKRQQAYMYTVRAITISRGYPNWLFPTKMNAPCNPSLDIVCSPSQEALQLHGQADQLQALALSVLFCETLYVSGQAPCIRRYGRQLVCLLIPVCLEAHRCYTGLSLA